MTEKYTKRYETGRYYLIALSAFTLLNIVLLLFNSDLYFIFSASIPYFTAIMPWILAAEISSYASWIFPMMIAAILMLVPYGLTIFFGKSPQKYGWMILSLVCFAIDTAGYFVLFGISVDTLIDLVIHIWVLISLILAVHAAVKLKETEGAAPLK